MCKPPLDSFSGVNCAGLIEAAPKSQIAATALGFSGVNCAGLIEAIFAIVDSKSAWAFSGVNCAGLIEAAAAASRFCASCCFPALIAPASLKQ